MTWRLSTSFEGADVTHELANLSSEAVVRPPGREGYAFGRVRQRMTADPFIADAA